jgi:hypothetical protein
MSHFNVLVFGDENQLRPYQENNMGDCPQEFLEFQDCTEEVKKGWKEKTENSFSVIGQLTLPEKDLETLVENKVLKLTDFIPDGLKSLEKGQRWIINEQFHIEIVYSKKGAGGFTFIADLIDPPKEIPVKDIYDNMEDFNDAWYGYELENGKYGYWENPNAKWDWYEEGGRWENMILLKDGRKVNSALAKDIDFEKMIKEDLDYRLSFYDKYTEGLNLLLPHEKWIDVHNRNSRNIEQAREEYNLQPNVIKFKENAKGHWAEPDDYIMPREDFIKSLNLLSHAFIYEGKWEEESEMGMFAMTGPKNETYKQKLENVIKNLDGETLVTMFDCHI